MGAEGPRECPDGKDPEWQLEMGQGHTTAPQEVRGTGREKSSWLGLWGTICVLGKCCLWAEFCGLWWEMVAAWSLNSEVPDGATMCDTLKKAEEPGHPGWVPRSWEVGGGGADSSWCISGPGGQDPYRGPRSRQQGTCSCFLHKQGEIGRDKAHTLRRQFPVMIFKGNK